MSKTKKAFLTVVATVVCLFPLRSAAETPNWQGKMKSLADTMGKLLPELFSAHGDPQEIEKGAKALSELSHDLKEGRMSGKLTPPADSDPSLTLFADQFSSQARRAYSAIKHGNTEYGKNLLRTVTSYCVACHTRHENGPQFSGFPLSEKAESLGRQEKAELHVATRQFDKGLAEYRALIADQELAKTRPFDWERPLRNALAISVRVKKDPAMAEDLVSTALKSPSLPEFERSRLLKWKHAIENWKKEPAPKATSEKYYASEMRRLLKEASKAQLYPIDQSAEIQYLRASAAAHDVLRTGHDPKLIAEALLTAGASYEALANPSMWTLHEFFYEGCIRQLPHSSIAEDCYSRFEQSVYVGYTGSSGTHIPVDIQEVLGQLKSLAGPNAPTGKRKQ